MRGGGDGANGNSSLRAIAGRFDFFFFFFAVSWIVVCTGGRF